MLGHGLDMHGRLLLGGLADLDMTDPLDYRGLLSAHRRVSHSAGRACLDRATDPRDDRL